MSKIIIPQGYSAVTDSGVLAVDTLSVFDNGVNDPLHVAEVMPWSRTATVGDFLQAQHAYSAHRGGSTNWPEMSLRAYTQAVTRGFDCLEVSLARTSDGVWFGLHDASINRTSGTTGLPNASSMTWADVQNYQINTPPGNPGYGPAPYMRLEELVDAYGKTHILMVDPKNQAGNSANLTELLDYMDAHGGPDRWIAKFVGNASVWLNLAKARGYERWVAFYEPDTTYGGGTGLATCIANGYATLLGMDYTAASGAWTEVTSYGLPVMGHVCPTQAAVNQCFTYGAWGAQVSGVSAVDTDL